MPKGSHYGRIRKRPYTSEYFKISAKVFKPLLISSLGGYTLNSGSLSSEHKQFKLTETKSGTRIITFTINNKAHKIALRLDNRSVSNKLYITCPYCHKQRQHLYEVKYAYACRECLGLHYASQAERSRNRLMRKIRNKRKSIWGANWPDVNNMFAHSSYWAKPKGKHWITFLKETAELEQLERQYWPMVASHFNLQFGHLDGYHQK